MRSTLVKVAALVGAGLLLLSGCATGDPNVAATVNGQVLTEQRVTQLSDVISQTYLAAWQDQQTANKQTVDAATLTKQQIAMAPGKYRLAVVAVTVQGQLAHEAAQSVNMTITDAQRQKVISGDTGLTALAANPVTADFINTLADVQVVFNTTEGLAAGQQVAAKAVVDLNPRYGTWTPRQLALTGTGSLSMSTTSTTTQQ